ncbi:MAG: hypothetical protein Q8O67_07155 [Deltaproteobacteria bacterium]|nr:hypothetical protein [Deltaproteobacteria bacterium]
MQLLLLMACAALASAAAVAASDDVVSTPTPPSSAEERLDPNAAPTPVATPVDVASPAARAKFRRVAVYDLTLDGVEPRIGRFVTDALVVELRKLDAVSVVAMDEVRAMLAHEAEKELMGCSEGASCLSEIGDALGVDELIVGTLSMAGASSTLTLRRLDQAQARAVGTVTERLTPLAGEEFLAAVGPAVEKLFPTEQLRGGQVRGVPPEQARRLNPPPLPLWAPVATASAALIALAGGAAVGVATLSEETALRSLIEESKSAPVPGKFVVEASDRANSYALTSNVLFGVAAGIGLIAVAMVPFTDFTPAPTE